MPIYEYCCDDCGQASSRFFRSVSAVAQPSCPACGSSRLSRLVSKAFHVRGEAQRLAEMDTSRVLGRLDGGDIASFERWARRTGSELDSVLGSNFRELADKAAAGQDPVERIDVGHKLRYEVQRRLSEVQGGGESSATPE